MELSCCSCGLAATAGAHAVCSGCERPVHYGSVCSAVLNIPATGVETRLCLPCTHAHAETALVEAAAGEAIGGSGGPALKATFPGSRTIETPRSILKSPSNSFDSERGQDRPNSSATSTVVASILSRAKVDAKAAGQRRKPGEFPPLLKVADPCNMRHQQGLTLSTRIKSLQNLYTVLIENDPRIQVESLDVTPTAVACELKLFQSTRFDTSYRMAFMRLRKQITTKTSAGEIFDIDAWLQDGSDQAPVHPTKRSEEVHPPTESVQKSTTVELPNEKAESDVSSAEVPSGSASAAASTVDLECGCRVVVVETAEQLETMLMLLTSGDGSVAVDIEGVNLGPAGKLSTVQLCGNDSNDVIICDVPALGDDAFSTIRPSLRGLLENPNVLKLFWDCRTDCAALYHLHGVRPRGVLDLQVYQVAVDVAAGSPPKYLSGLGRVLSQSRPAILQASDRDRLDEIKRKARALFAPDRGGDFQVWMERPLRPILLEYATDVRFFHTLKQGLCKSRNGWCHGVEEIFGDLLGTLSEERASRACSVDSAATTPAGKSGAHVEKELLEKLQAKLSDGESTTTVERKRTAADSFPGSLSATVERLAEDLILPQKRARTVHSTAKNCAAEVIKRTLQPYYTARQIDKAQFKDAAKKLTIELMAMNLSSTTDLTARAKSLVRCWVTDLNPILTYVCVVRWSSSLSTSDAKFDPDALAAAASSVA